MNLLIVADDDSVARNVPGASVDLLISLGDLPDEVILQVSEKCNCRVILAVKGNHDSSAPFRAPIRNAHLTTFTFHGLTFGGFGGAWKYKPRGHHLFEQPEVEQHLAHFPHVDVFLAHNSPRLIHDREDEVHTGFTAFNTYIERVRPKLFLHGHQHENRETMVGTTKVIGTFGHRLITLPAH